MAGINAVNSASVPQVAAPSHAGKTQATYAVLPTPGQGGQEDNLTISSQGLKALEDPQVAVLVLGKRHRHEADVVLLTYPNFQVAGNTPVPAQAQGGAAAQPGTPGQTAPVAGVQSAGSSGAAKA
jgi:hypothetical protein